MIAIEQIPDDWVIECNKEGVVRGSQVVSVKVKYRKAGDEPCEFLYLFPRCDSDEEIEQKKQTAINCAKIELAKKQISRQAK